MGMDGLSLLGSGKAFPGPSASVDCRKRPQSFLLQDVTGFPTETAPTEILPPCSVVYNNPPLCLSVCSKPVSVPLYVVGTLGSQGAAVASPSENQTIHFQFCLCVHPFFISSLPQPGQVPGAVQSSATKNTRSHKNEHSHSQHFYINRESRRQGLEWRLSS